jgi:hypothetical protein
MDRGHLVENCRLLGNLDTHIDEDPLMRSISQLRNELDKIESVSGRSQRTNKMRIEVQKMEDQLSYCKNQSNHHTRQPHSTKSED